MVRHSCLVLMLLTHKASATVPQCDDGDNNNNDGDDDDDDDDCLSSPSISAITVNPIPQPTAFTVDDLDDATMGSTTEHTRTMPAGHHWQLRQRIGSEVASESDHEDDHPSRSALIAQSRHDSAREPAAVGRASRSSHQLIAL